MWKINKQKKNPFPSFYYKMKKIKNNLKIKEFFIDISLMENSLHCSYFSPLVTTQADTWEPLNYKQLLSAFKRDQGNSNAKRIKWKKV